MKPLQLYSDRVEFDKNKYYSIPKVISNENVITTEDKLNWPIKNIEYTFKFSAESTNILYGQYIHYNCETEMFQFKRYPDNIMVYIRPYDADITYRYGIIEYDNLDELILAQIN